MNARYIFLSIVLIALGVIIVFITEQDNTKELDAKRLLSELHDNTRFLSTDYVADLIVNKDPLVTLIDVRTENHYDEFHLDGAINIPLDVILDRLNQEFLNQKVNKVILYSNGTIYANQAWMLCKRMGYENIYVMRGGLNRWIETIMRPQKPPQGSPSEEIDLYEFRVAAQRYFGGGAATVTVDATPSIKPPPVKRQKKRENEEEGGC